jgi:PIN domain nuclease of toxin-antitoxin system
MPKAFRSMKVLIDSHIFLWWADDKPSSLSRRARKVLGEQSNQLLFSVASAWELTLKLDRLGLTDHFEPLLQAGIRELGLTILGSELRHVIYSGSLPWIHRDPFDRMLISQALLEGVPILTADERIKQYPVEVIS